MSRFSRRHFLKAAGIGAGALMIPGAMLRAADAGKKSLDGTQGRPNIVFILIDDMGWKDVGCMGSHYYETPNIDKLAAGGMAFTSAYTCGPNCAPTRASLLTGMYTPRHGIFTVGGSGRGPRKGMKIKTPANTTVLDPKWVTIAETLEKAGYVSASMGKWHLGTDPESGPEAQGFDVNIGGNSSGQPSRYFSPYQRPNLTDVDGEYLTDRLTDEAIKFIETNREKPFFLYLPHYAVHTPLGAKQAMIAKYEQKPACDGQGNATYAAMIESVDQGVGRIMDSLDKLKLADNTLVIFSSDNGGVGGITSMLPLRGWKGMLYEGGVRVPLIVRWPGKVEAGSKCDEPVISVDFHPTLAELVGAKMPETQPVDGLSLLPLLEGRPDLAREAIYWHFPCYLQGDGLGSGFRMKPAAAIRAGDWKLIEWFEDGNLELFNLKADPGEQKDLSKTQPAKTRELHTMLLAWREKVKAPVPTEKNPDYDPSATGAAGAGRGGRGKDKTSLKAVGEE